MGLDGVAADPVWEAPVAPRSRASQPGRSSMAREQPLSAHSSDPRNKRIEPLPCCCRRADSSHPCTWLVGHPVPLLVPRSARLPGARGEPRARQRSLPRRSTCPSGWQQSRVQRLSRHCGRVLWERETRASDRLGEDCSTMIALPSRCPGESPGEGTWSCKPGGSASELGLTMSRSKAVAALARFPVAGPDSRPAARERQGWNSVRVQQVTSAPTCLGARGEARRRASGEEESNATGLDNGERCSKPWGMVAFLSVT
jgi:hypothetical protein